MNTNFIWYEYFIQMHWHKTREKLARHSHGTVILLLLSLLVEVLPAVSLLYCQVLKKAVQASVARWRFPKQLIFSHIILQEQIKVKSLLHFFLNKSGPRREHFAKSPTASHIWRMHCSESLPSYWLFLMLHHTTLWLACTVSLSAWFRLFLVFESLPNKQETTGMKTEQSLLYFIFKRSALKRVPTMALHKIIGHFTCLESLP